MICLNTDLKMNCFYVLDYMEGKCSINEFRS